MFSAVWWNLWSLPPGLLKLLSGATPLQLCHLQSRGRETRLSLCFQSPATDTHPTLWSSALIDTESIVVAERDRWKVLGGSGLAWRLSG